jgi:hypothetical protein
MRELGITDIVLTLVRIGLLLLLIYGILAAAGYGVLSFFGWLHDMWEVVWNSESGPFVVVAVMVIGAVWLVFTVLTTPVAAFWK